MEFAERTVLITGGATGIGFQTARQLAAAGATVALLNDRQSDIDAALAALSDEGHAAIGLAADVSDADAMEAAFARLDEAPFPLRGLVCSAAIQPFGTVTSMAPAQWAKVQAVNVNGAYLAAHFAIPRMAAAGGGSIVNVSSVQGSATQARVAAYSTSKGALMALTRAIAVDHAEDGIRANSVSPGCIDAPLTRWAAEVNAPPEERDALVAAWGRMQPLGRAGQPDEVAQMIVFLLSERASFCSGADYKVDGGCLAKLGVVLPD